MRRKCLGVFVNVHFREFPILRWLFFRSFDWNLVEQDGQTFTDIIVAIIKVLFLNIIVPQSYSSFRYK